MPSRDTTEPPLRRGATPSNKRKFRETYDPSTNEQFPQDPWHTLNHEVIIDQVGELCDEFTIPLEKYAGVDEAIQNLKTQAEAAKKLPDMKKLRVAVLGEQGIGKSTLVNALLDRKILDKSAGSTACTAYATTIEHKPGAADNTQVSDVKIEFFSEQEIDAFVKDQHNRWVDCYPGPQARQREAHAQDSDESSSEEPSDEAFTPAADTGNDKKKLQKSAKTAKEFFGIVFDIEENAHNKTWLENTLHKTNIREGDFRQRCILQARDHLNKIATRLKAQNGIVVEPNVSDKKLVQIRNIVKKIWPFVKAVTVATGHVLLRHGISFVDLPGYGDTSQLRDAVVNRYRETADYEIVVTPHARLQTSTVHDRYLDRSLSKGANRTMLVMTKSDALFDEDDYHEEISQLQEEPFISLNARRERLDKIAEQDGDEIEDEEIDLEMLKEQLAREVAAAIIQRETQLIKKSMRDKAIKIFSTSPKEHQKWKNPNRFRDPILDLGTCGILALRRYLFSLPANTNFQRFWDHIFQDLPKLRKRATRVQEKHVGDVGYAQMQRQLELETPALTIQLHITAETQMKRLITSPWAPYEEQKVIDLIDSLITQKWKHPLIFYAGFAKMLRENGIPVDGKYYGRNLNEELLGTMLRYINNWNIKMTAQAEKLVQLLNTPVRDFMQAIQLRIESSSAVPALKERAKEALADASQGVEEARVILLESLLDTLGENHLRYTSEVDILCPIAQEMQPRYERAQEERFVGAGGKGIYQKQRNVLRETVSNPSRHYSRLQPIERMRPLLKNLKEQLMGRQHELWKANCTTFIEAADTQLQEFSRIAAELLMNAAYQTEEHRKARELLQRLLVDFDRSLKDIQDQFVDAEKQHSAKKTKVKLEEDVDDPDAAPAETMQLVPVRGPEIAVPILQNLGWHHFLATFGRLG